MNKRMKGLLVIVLITFLFGSCKKCITCKAYDASSGEVKFTEKSCANGPLQDDWVKGIEDAYPSPAYNTICK